MPVVIELLDGRRARLDYTEWTSEHATLADVLTFLFGPGGEHPDLNGSVGNDPEGNRAWVALALFGGRVVAKARAWSTCRVTERASSETAPWSVDLRA